MKETQPVWLTRTLKSRRLYQRVGEHGQRQIFRAFEVWSGAVLVVCSCGANCREEFRNRGKPGGNSVNCSLCFRPMSLQPETFSKPVIKLNPGLHTTHYTLHTRRMIFGLQNEVCGPVLLYIG